MKSGLLLLFAAAAFPALAQYGGPAILSRGDAPSGMSSPQIDFRPFVGVYGTYNTGLANVSLNDQGGLAFDSSIGVSLNWGVSGVHTWRHTSLGLAYSGALTHYVKSSGYDSLDQALMLGFSRQISRHIQFSSHVDTGFSNRNQRLQTLEQTVPFDPATTYAPTTDFFDNRTMYFSSQSDLIYQKSNRLSFSFGGDAFTTRRRSEALYDLSGVGAQGDVQYRVSRRQTIGAQYTYTKFDFSRIFGGTDLHGASFTYAAQLSRLVEFGAYVGAYRVESKFVETVPIDPVIAQLLGISSGTRVGHYINYLPNVGARLSRTFARGVLSVAGGRSITPGNGLFLTSVATSAMAGYNYAGFRRWSLSTSIMYSEAQSLGNVRGPYSEIAGSLFTSRTLGHGMNFVTSYTARKYTSSVYNNYNRVVHSVSVGLGYSPGEVPLRVW